MRIEVLKEKTVDGKKVQLLGYFGGTEEHPPLMYHLIVDGEKEHVCSDIIEAAKYCENLIIGLSYDELKRKRKTP